MSDSNGNLLELINDQKKTIEKYSNKLRDVVEAHKKVLKEKKILEETIQSLNEAKNESNIPNTQPNCPTDAKAINEDLTKVEGNQTSNLLRSISNLIAEKSQMENSFKTTQKQLLEEKKTIENKCKELEEENTKLFKELKLIESKKNDCKRKNKKDASNSKFVEDRKMQNSDNEVSLALQIKNFKKEVENLNCELEAKNVIYESSQKKLRDNSLEISKLHEDVKNLQIEHQAALLREKKKVKETEEQAKKINASQEQRIINLEAKLAELSEAIGSYDRIRLQDQAEILRLKSYISNSNNQEKEISEDIQVGKKNYENYDVMIKRVLELKEQLQKLASKSGKDEHFNSLFPEALTDDICHTQCKEDYEKLKNEFELFKNEVKLYGEQQKSGKEVSVFQNQVKSLQEKIRLMNDKNKSLEKEYQLQMDQLIKTMKNEKTRFKEILTASELDFKGKIWFLEEQLQKQRERSLALLEEKEQELHSFQSIFQSFLPGFNRTADNEPDCETNKMAKQFVDGPHIVHYANELARKDVEISSLRKSKHQIDMTCRNLQKEIISITQKYEEDKQLLKAEIDRLERSKTREGANLEYLKNVVYSFLLSSDPKCKRHMCNAIAAVLNFTEYELQNVTQHSKNSWWST